MADVSVERRSIINSLLCFTLTKFGNSDIKRIKSAVLTKYQSEDISIAKKLLLKDISELTLSKPLSNSRQLESTRQGDNKSVAEVNDIIDIIHQLDDRKSLSLLSRYVTDNSDSLPILPLEEGELGFLMSKLDKMEAIIQGLQSTVHTLAASLRPTSSSFVTSAAGPMSLPPAQSGYVRALQQPRLHQTSTEPAEKPPTEKPDDVHNNHASVRIDTHARRGANRDDRKAAWSDVVEAEHRSDQNYASSSAGSNFGDVDDGYQLVVSPYHKRQRTRSSRQQADAAAAASAVASGGGERVIGNGRKNPTSTTAGRAHTATQETGKDKTSRSKPLLIGRKTSAPQMLSSTPTIAAARSFKSVYLVDNLANSCDIKALTTFVLRMNVRLLTCYEVKPRMSRWQHAHNIIPDHRAYRVCINKADSERFLDEAKWPADITISRWYSLKNRAAAAESNDQPHDSAGAAVGVAPPTDSSDASNRSILHVAVSAQLTHVAKTAAAAEAAVNAVGDDDIEMNDGDEETDGDATVTEIDLTNITIVNDDRRRNSLTSTDGGDKQQ